VDGIVTRFLILTADQGEDVFLANLKGRQRLILTQAQLYAQDGKINLVSNGSNHFNFRSFPGWPVLRQAI
jgi:hypothetical protein